MATIVIKTETGSLYFVPPADADGYSVVTVVKPGQTTTKRMRVGGEARLSHTETFEIVGPIREGSSMAFFAPAEFAGRIIECPIMTSVIVKIEAMS